MTAQILMAIMSLVQSGLNLPRRLKTGRGPALSDPLAKIFVGDDPHQVSTLRVKSVTARKWGLNPEVTDFPRQ